MDAARGCMDSLCWSSIPEMSSVAAERGRFGKGRGAAMEWSCIVLRDFEAWSPGAGALVPPSCRSALDIDK